MRDIEVRIPDTCSADWDQMTPADKGRFCGECQTRVVDLSAMTERQAERFLHRNANNEALCVSFVHDPAGGDIVFRKPAPLIPLSRLVKLAPAAGLAVALAACTPSSGPAPVPSDPPPPAIELADIKPATAATRSLLTNPRDAVPPPSAAHGNEDEPCDGAGSEEPVAPTITTAPEFTRTAGAPVVRMKGRRASPR